MFKCCSWENGAHFGDPRMNVGFIFFKIAQHAAIAAGSERFQPVCKSKAPPGTKPMTLLSS